MASVRENGSGKSDLQSLRVGLAKLKGEDFEYFMQNYSIMLGRNSKKATVDVDLSGLGGGMNISRNHARIFYNFDAKEFQIEILGKNGVYIDGVQHQASPTPLKLSSQQLIQIGDKKFYFLLPPKRKRATNHDAHKSRAASQGHDNAGKAANSTAAHVKGSLPQQDMQPRKRSRIGEENQGSRNEVAAGLRNNDNKLNVLGALDEPGVVEKVLIKTVEEILSNQDGVEREMPVARLHAELAEDHQEIFVAAVAAGLLSRDVSAVSVAASSPEAPGQLSPSSDQPKAMVKPWMALATMLRKHEGKFAFSSKQKGRLLVEHVSLVKDVLTHPAKDR